MATDPRGFISVPTPGENGNADENEEEENESENENRNERRGREIWELRMGGRLTALLSWE